MNSPLARWLLDLETIPTDAENLRLAWEHPLPAWLWALLIVAAALLAFWSYTQLTGSRGARGVLATIRLGIIALALVIIAGPMIELPRESIEQDWVLMLLDRSESMTVGDAPLADRAGRTTRDEQLRRILARHDSTWRTLADDHHVSWLGFHSGVFSLTEEGENPPADRDAAPNESPPAATDPGSFRGLDLDEPTGDRTDLNAAIEQTLQRAAARPVSGIVLFSDGRTVSPPSRALVRRLQAEAIPVFVLPLGSDEPLGDLALRRVEAPRRAFVRDKVPVVVEIDRFGSAVRDLGGTIRLVDELTGETLDELEIAPGDPREQITLTAEPQLTGEATWRVEIDTPQPDLVPENNARRLAIELVDRPLRVLYVEGYPRWEYRYLKNLLIREQSIESSVMLLSADRDFAQEGNQPITRLPRSAEEFARFDVIVLGDVPGTFFSPEQLELMRAHIAERGAGMLWIGGEQSTPQTYAGTVLADLLPIRGSLELPAIDEPVTMRPTDLAERLGVLRIVSGGEGGWPDALADPSFGWSQLQYAQQIEPARLKPTAEALAQTTLPLAGDYLPLVLHMRYGAGQSIYVATDEIWRWRYGRGEAIPEQFWIQMIRMLGRASLATAGEQAVLEVSPRRLEAGQPLRIDLRLLDARLVNPTRAAVPAVLETAEGRAVAELELRRVPGAEDRYAASYLAERSGSLRVRLTDPELADLELSAPVEIFAPDDELRRPETNHRLLADLAAATDGEVLDDDSVDRLPGILPNREVRTLNPLRERIWDTPLAFILVLVALTAEWVGRRLLRLI